MALATAPSGCWLRLRYVRINTFRAIDQWHSKRENPAIKIPGPSLVAVMNSSARSAARFAAYAQGTPNDRRSAKGTRDFCSPGCRLFSHLGIGDRPHLTGAKSEGRPVRGRPCWGWRTQGCEL